MSAAGGNFLKLFFSLNVLLLFIPLSLYLEYLRPQAHTLIFFSACLGIIPLAGWMGKATEQIADRAGEGIGGLLNATFGNAAELIIAIVALRAGYLEIVKASLTAPSSATSCSCWGRPFWRVDCATKSRSTTSFRPGPRPRCYC